MSPVNGSKNGLISQNTHWTSQEILQVTNGCTIGKSKNWRAIGAAIYSFKVQPGDLFILLVHHKNRVDFVKEAFQRGAAGALLTITDQDVKTMLSEHELSSCIFVNNSNDALTELGVHAARSNSSCTKIAITGSVGKTSTKEGLAQILSAIRVAEGKGQRVHSNFLNENNPVGVPLSMLRMPRNGEVDYCVQELGMSAPNEISRLVHIVQPSIVIITRIGESHLSSFSCVEEIVDAKCEIFETNLDSDGNSRNIAAILNRDDKYYSRILSNALEKKITRIVTFGEHPEATFQLLKFTMDCKGTQATVKYEDEVHNYYVGQPGKGWVWNSLAIIAAVHCLIPSALREAMDQLKELKSVTGRGTTYSVPVPGGSTGQITVIDDSYNSSPISITCGLEMVELLRGKKSEDHIQERNRARTIAVLGDMLELGSTELRYHLDLKSVLEANHIDLVFVCGPLMNQLFDTLDMRMRGGCVALYSADLIPQLKNIVEADDIIYVKGSRSMRMELIVDAFTGEQK